jgi:hypothetical protein
MYTGGLRRRSYSTDVTTYNNTRCTKMKYKREGTIEDNNRSCVLKSAASALSFLGYNCLAFNLCNNVENGRKMECRFEFFPNCMDSSKLEKQERRKIQFAKLKSGVSK